jgi:hypothetical protein
MDSGGTLGRGLLEAREQGVNQLVTVDRAQNTQPRRFHTQSSVVGGVLTGLGTVVVTQGSEPVNYQGLWDHLRGDWGVG